MKQEAHIHRIVERVLQDGSKRTFPGHKRAAQTRSGDGVLTSYTHINMKGELVEHKSYIEIFSTELQEVLKDVFRDYPDDFVKIQPMRFRHPFYPLIHRHQAIRDLAESPAISATARDHLAKLVLFLEADLKTEIQDFDLMRNFEKTVTFDQLWTIFVPGEVVIKKDEPHVEECWEIYEIEYDTYPGNAQYNSFNVAARQLRYSQDGRGYFLVERIPLQVYSGARSISGLDLIPLKSRQDWKHYRETKISDGRKWWEIVSHAMQYHANYNAIAFTDDKFLFPPEEWNGNSCMSWLSMEYNRKLTTFKPIHITGEIIIDQAAYAEANPQHASSLDTELDLSQGLTDDQALLAPARVEGFSLDVKIWALFQVRDIRGVDWSSASAYRRLEIGEEKKSLLTNLIVSQHESMKEFDTQSLLRKSNPGLIFLLHGGPGTGKTLTAQAMAEHIQRPLYSTTSGELSKNGQLEINLRKALRWCRRWRAVFLLDEADVFLAKREISRETTRNEMVTVFLQQIEGFSGIMFFSTNHKLEDFDSAFMSRIHAIVLYKELTNRQKYLIWKSHCSEWGVQLSDEDLQQLVERSGELSGRDIRNVVQMAVLLRDTPSWRMSVDTICRLIQFRADSLNEVEDK